MYELLLPVGLLATFSTFMVGGLAVESARQKRRETMRMLEAQIPAGPVDQREQELARPFLDRVALPVLSTLGKVARRLTPLDTGKRIEHKLVLAGSPAGWDADKVAAFKLIGVAVGAFIAFSLTRVAHFSGSRSFFAIALFAGIGCAIPGAMIGQKSAARQESIRKSLPDTMDLLTISVEAGLGFDAALVQVVRNVPGPLSEEISRLLQEMQLGVSRVDAFRHLADRTNVEELRGFVLAMIQADIFGVSIAGVLRSQAKDLRVKRRQRAEKKAMTSPLKLLFPLIFCILPALFVVVIGPGVIRIVHNFFGIGG